MITSVQSPGSASQCRCGARPCAEVTQNVLRTGYPMEKVHFIEGKVEDSGAPLPNVSALDKIIVAFAGPLAHLATPRWAERRLSPAASERLARRSFSTTSKTGR